MDEKYLTEREVSGMTGLSVFTLRNNRSTRKGIDYHKIGRSVRYALRDVISFMDFHKISIEDANLKKTKTKKESRNGQGRSGNEQH